MATRCESIASMGQTPNGGSIGATGQVRLDPAAGFPGAVQLTGERAQLVANDVVTAVGDMSLDVTGALARTPNVAGRITIVSMEITVPERLGSVSSPIPGTRHINPTATARALLALNAKARSASSAGAAVQRDAGPDDIGAEPDFRSRSRHQCGNERRSARQRARGRSDR